MTLKCSFYDRQDRFRFFHVFVLPDTMKDKAVRKFAIKWAKSINRRIKDVKVELIK